MSSKKKTTVKPQAPKKKKAAAPPDPLDGGSFGAGGLQPGKTWLDYTDDPERPGYRLGVSTQQISGKTTIDLTRGIRDSHVIPPKGIWERGQWKNKNPSADDGNEWVVSGQGTPGNWEFRIYQVPPHMSFEAEPPHPSKWKKADREVRPYETSSAWLPKPAQSQYQSSQPWKSAPQPKKITTASSGLPNSVRMLCIGCGHYFKVDDLVDHAKTGVCPSQQGEIVNIVQPCACCLSIFESATVREGFPKKKPEETTT